MQVPLQRLVPRAAQAQALLVQTKLGQKFSPQVPQFSGSSVMSVHWPKQFVWPAAHWHWPLRQVPLSQKLKHSPQLNGSVLVLVHSPPQFWKPAPLQPQTLFWQVVPWAHTLAQPPQLLASVRSSTQRPLQSS